VITRLGQRESEPAVAAGSPHPGGDGRSGKRLLSIQTCDYSQRNVENVMVS